MSNPDRTVHATSVDGYEVVRYDRGGKWWLERADGTRATLRIPTAVDEAVRFERAGGTIHEGLPGGATFDAKVRKARTIPNHWG